MNAEAERVSVLEPTNLRLSSVLVAFAFAVTSCVTTAAVAPASVGAVAGLPEDKEATLQSTDGVETVDGSTLVILHATEGKNQTTHEARLSSLRSEDGALLIPGQDHPVALNDIWSAEVTKPAPGRTVGLVVGIVLGTAALATLTFFTAGAIALSNLKL